MPNEHDESKVSRRVKDFTPDYVEGWNEGCAAMHKQVIEIVNTSPAPLVIVDMREHNTLTAEVERLKQGKHTRDKLLDFIVHDLGVEGLDQSSGAIETTRIIRKSIADLKAEVERLNKSRANYQAEALRQFTDNARLRGLIGESIELVNQLYIHPQCDCLRCEQRRDFLMRARAKLADKPAVEGEKP